MFTPLPPPPPPPGAPPPPGPKPPVKRSPSSRAHLRDLVDQLFNVEIEQLVAVGIKLAKSGDGQMLRWIVDRASPPRRSRPITIKDFRKIATVQDALAEMARLSELVAKGELTADEASGVAALLREFITATDVADLAKRLEAVEKAIAQVRDTNSRRHPNW